MSSYLAQNVNPQSLSTLLFIKQSNCTMAISRLVIISEICNATQHIGEVCCDNMENDVGLQFV